jgi:hypothetical protein
MKANTVSPIGTQAEADAESLDIDEPAPMWSKLDEDELQELLLALGPLLEPDE